MQNKLKKDQCLFGVVTHDETPRRVSILESDDVKIRDEHTGFEISTEVRIPSSTYNVSDFISKIEP